MASGFESSSPSAPPPHHEPRSASQREFRGFHETRDTNHGFFLAFSPITLWMPWPVLPTIARYCSLLPGSPGAVWQAPRALRQPGHRLHRCIATPRKRPFPGNKSPLRKIPPESHGRPDPQGFRFSRITKHETRNTAFFRNTNHETRLFSPVIKWKELACQALEPQPYRLPRSWGSRITRHETRDTAFYRITNHGLCA